MGPWEGIKHEKPSREESRRIRDAQIAADREKHPGVARAHDAAQWLAVLLTGAVLHKALPGNDAAEIAGGLIRNIGAFGMGVNLIENVPGPTQWPRIARKLRDTNWWNAKGDTAP